MSAPVLEQLQQQFGVASRGVMHGALVLELDPPALVPTVQRLRDDFGFDLFLDVTAVDWPDAPLRFEVVWHFYSTAHKVRVRIKTRVREKDPTVDTLISLYGSAHYMERECHDMYGIRFRGNPDYGGAVATITRDKQQKLLRTARFFLLCHKEHQQRDCRFDVVGITPGPSGGSRFDWIQDAFC